MTKPLQEIERAVHAALATYSNVHRGSGHHALVSTRLYEQARDIVLEYLGLDRKKYVVIFCTPRRAATLQARLAPGSHRCVSSQDIDLPIGLRALAVLRKGLPKGIPRETGGGTARLVAPGWVIWSGDPDRFEAGTPAITNVIAFARALQLRRHGQGAFQDATPAQPGTDERDDLDEYSGRALLSKLRQTLIGQGARVPTVDGERPYVNLDNGGSTPTFQPIWDAVRRSWHTPSQARQAIIERARSTCAEVLGAPLAFHDVIFTSNTTEAINLVAESLGKETGQGTDPDVEPVVLNTFLEHNSNELPWRTTAGLSLIRLPVDAEGFIDLAELEALLHAYNQARLHGRKRIKLVAVSGASNVLGVYNHLAQISPIVHRYGARLLVDAAQWVAHRKVDMEPCGIDYLAFSGHKVYAPFGTGVLLARKGLLAFSPAEMDAIRSSGEENVGGIAGLAKALDLLWRIGFDTIQSEEQALTSRALSGLASLPRIKVYGIRDPDSPRFPDKGGVIVFGMKGMMPGRVAKALAERGGIGVRTGCHCAHLTIKRLLGVPPWAEQIQRLMLSLSPGFNLPGLVRVSFGIQSTEAEVDSLIAVLGAITQKPRNQGIGRRMEDFVTAATERVYASIAVHGRTKSMT
jgi:selenocysteine lyase/cysteine desulfurase